jgi:signal transduction histidine kinase
MALWGLPISIMTPIGNLLFGPSLSAFLGLALLLFISEIFCIPNIFLAKFFSWISHQWYTVLCYGSPQWLIGIPLHWGIVLIPPILVLFLVATRKKSIGYRTLHANLILVAIVSFLHFFGHSANISHQFSSRKRTLLLEFHNDSAILIDNGFLETKQNPSSWFSFTLRPFMLQKAGTLHIDHLICQKTTTATLITVCCMIDFFIISRITIRTNKHQPLDPTAQKKLSLTTQKHNILLEVL